MTDARKLARHLTGISRGSLRLRLGTVQAVNSDRTIDVTLGGSSTTVTGVKCLTGAVPVDGAAVLLLTDGYELVVIGSVADDTSPGFTPLTQYGSATVNFSASAGATGTVNFDWSFPSAPLVIVSCSRTSSGNKVVAVNADTVTASSFLAAARVVDGTSVTDSVTVRWVALSNGA